MSNQSSQDPYRITIAQSIHSVFLGGPLVWLGAFALGLIVLMPFGLALSLCLMGFLAISTGTSPLAGFPAIAIGLWLTWLYARLIFGFGDGKKQPHMS